MCSFGSPDSLFGLPPMTVPPAKVPIKRILRPCGVAVGRCRGRSRRWRPPGSGPCGGGGPALGRDFRSGANQGTVSRLTPDFPEEPLFLRSGRVSSRRLEIATASVGRGGLKPSRDLTTRSGISHAARRPDDPPLFPSRNDRNLGASVTVPGLGSGDTILFSARTLRRPGSFPPKPRLDDRPSAAAPAHHHIFHLRCHRHDLRHHLRQLSIVSPEPPEWLSRAKPLGSSRQGQTGQLPKQSDQTRKSPFGSARNASSGQ